MKGEKEPVLKNYYILRYPGGAQIGVRPKEDNQIKVLEQLLMKQLLVGIPTPGCLAVRVPVWRF